MNQCTVLSSAASSSHCLLLKISSQFRVNTPVKTEGSFQLWAAFSSLFLQFNIFALPFYAFLWSPVASFHNRPAEVIFSSLWKVLHEAVTIVWRKPFLPYINKCCPLSGFIYLYHFLLFSFFKPSSIFPFLDNTPYFKLEQCTLVPYPYIGLHSNSFPYFVCLLLFLKPCFITFTSMLQRCSCYQG